MPRRKLQPEPKVEFTNTTKLFFPKTRFTKGDVIKYYLEVAPWLLPHLANRPVTLKRFPDGIHGQFFYEKDAPGYTPDWVPTFPVPRREGGEPIHYILVNDARVLAWCANLGTVEFHPFLHRVPAIDSPTAIAFDLDPGDGADLRDCARVALRLREVLGELKLETWPKVSGSKGLQVFLPLNTPGAYEATQAFAKSVAELLHRERPEHIVSEMAKAVRHGRVFIDWSQNSDFKTTIGVYSLRAKHEEPYVSMPVTWDEVAAAKTKAGMEALFFGPDAALRRLRKQGDLFASVQTLKQRLPEAFSENVGRGLRTPPVRRRRGPETPPYKGPAALRPYAEKRDFRVTPEPGLTPRRSAQGSRRRFVIQKHAASHLHYDFRLEMADSLKSWAVPKGLPYAVDERRSAFAMEDHPLDYLMFEGIIPAGQYGGGTVMVWDAGTYDIIDGNYWKGFLRVYLKGKKLKGEWTLTRAAANEGRARWVVTKSGEAMKPITSRRDDQSALTKRTMAQIAAAADAVWESGGGAGRNVEPPTSYRAEGDISHLQRRSTAEIPRRGEARRGRAGKSGRSEIRNPASGIRNLPPPEFVPPMLARGVAELPVGDDWLYEVKWDGYRAVALKHGDTVRLLSRKGNSLAKDFPGVVAAVRGLSAGTAVIDGEIVALDERGRPQFQMLQNRASAGEAQIVYYAYDLLQLEADDLRARPLAERKRRLAELIAGTDVRFSADLPGKPKDILAQAAKLGLEGIVAKRRSSPYESGERSGHWVKLKLSPEQEFVIGGYKPGKPLESLLVGYYDGRKLMFAGKVRQGLNPRNRVDLWRALKPLATEECPFSNLPNSKKSHFGEGVTPEQMKELRWTKPKLVAQVSFTEWTHSGNLRHATFLGLREDKVATEVVREAFAVATR